MKRFILSIVVVSVLLLPACSTQTESIPTTTTPTTTLVDTPTSTPTPTLPTTTTTGPPPTAGEMAISGKILYNQNCTYPDCHTGFIEGAEFNGPNMSQFANAELVFNIISDIMHLGISDMENETPSDEEYLQILAFLLIQDDYIQLEDQFGRANLSHILLAPLTATTPPTTTTTTTTTTPTTTTPVTTTTPTTTTPTTTWGELASRGAGSFSINCAPCHGPNGEGGLMGSPAIISGGRTTLTRYGTAWKLLAFISSWMPKSAPGSLPGSTYQQILAFILTKSGFVQPEAIFDENDLVNVIIE